MNIDLQCEMRTLQESWERFYGGWSPGLQEAVGRLNQRIGFNEEKDTNDWPQRFSTLTAFYPLLESEALSYRHKPIARDVTLGHFLLLVHSILDDRLLDGQYSFEAADHLMSKRLFFDGYRILRKCAASGADQFDRDFGLLLTEYEIAQSSTSDSPIPPLWKDIEFSSGEATAAGRAALGMAATLALNARLGLPKETSHMRRKAFAFLAVALQWVDDAQDWEADWLAGEENLIFRSLEESGVDLSSSGRSMDTLTLIRNQILQDGLLSRALIRAVDLLDAAEKIQLELGCSLLAGEIALFRKKSQDKLHDIGRVMQNVLADALLA